jgi:hypothetical protein
MMNRMRMDDDEDKREDSDIDEMAQIWTEQENAAQML